MQTVRLSSKNQIVLKLHADYRLKTPDVIQAASAISYGATGFICNDVNT
jgi:hypothetical protein